MADSDLVVAPGIAIPRDEMVLRFSRSSGAGGQNVNKVSSRAELCWDLGLTRAIPEDAKQRLRSLAGSRVSLRGVLRIASQVHRDQARNVAACRERLRALVRRALVAPKPRRPTNPTAGSVQRRIEHKKALGRIKRERGWKRGSEE
jgi:ribosome-associated protein